MTKAEYSLVSLLFLAFHVLGTQSSSLGTVFNGLASNNDMVPILKDSSGFYVQVNYTPSPRYTSDTGKFFLSLISPFTIFGSSCLNFNSYTCSQHNCIITSQTSKSMYDPYFTFKAKPAKIEAYLGQSWRLDVNGFLTDAGSCSSLVNPYIGTGRSGILGMSAGTSVQNYQAKPADGTLFSILMQKDQSGGTFYFFKNASLTSKLADPISLSIASDFHWSTPRTRWSFDFPSVSSYQAEYRLIFDAHLDAIALPEVVYDFILAGFRSYGFSCTTANYKPKCTTYGRYILNLPALVFEFQGKNISIPREIYLEDSVSHFQSQITLNFKKLRPNIAGESYIHPNYGDVVIFGTYFMSYYYTVFKSDSIEIYGPGSPNILQNSSNRIYIVAPLAILASVGMVVSSYMRAKKQKEQTVLSMEMASKNPSAV